MLDLFEYSDQLRRLCDEYYSHNIEYAEFKRLRNIILARLDAELSVSGQLVMLNKLDVRDLEHKLDHDLYTEID